MQIEYEATFINVSKDEIRNKLKQVGARLIKPEFMQRRTVFNLPAGHEIEGGWLRVGDEEDKITMSLKVVKNGKIEDQKEVCLKVDNMDNAIMFLESIGCEKKAYQENKRELWELGDVEVCIDEWPFLEPYVEIEGNSEEDVKSVSQKIGFKYDDAYFGAVDGLYAKKYNILEKVINETREVVFNTENPFIN